MSTFASNYSGVPLLWLRDLASCAACRKIVILMYQPGRVTFRDEHGNSVVVLPSTSHHEIVFLDPGPASRKAARFLLGKPEVARQGFARYERVGRPHVCKGGES